MLRSINFKRLQRFFRSFELDYSLIAKVIVRIIDIPQPWVLSTDTPLLSLSEIDPYGERITAIFQI